MTSFEIAIEQVGDAAQERVQRYFDAHRFVPAFVFADLVPAECIPTSADDTACNLAARDRDGIMCPLWPYPVRIRELGAQIIVWAHEPPYLPEIKSVLIAHVKSSP